MNTVCIIIDNIFKNSHHYILITHVACIRHFRFECMPKAFYGLIVHRMPWSGETAAKVHLIKRITHDFGCKTATVIRMIYSADRP